MKVGVASNHYRSGSMRTVAGSVTISAADMEEGKVEAAKAAKRNWGYQFPKMKMAELIRNWSQVKYSDAVFAVSSIAAAGERVFPDQANDTRKAIAPSVTGGTGYAVGMAINHNKPVFVFNQKPTKGYPVGWYAWDSKSRDFVPTETPALTKNFAGIGTRNLNAAGTQAIKDVYTKATKPADAANAGGKATAAAPTAVVGKAVVQPTKDVGVQSAQPPVSPINLSKETVEEKARVTPEVVPTSQVAEATAKAPEETTSKEAEVVSEPMPVAGMTALTLKADPDHEGKPLGAIFQSMKNRAAAFLTQEKTTVKRDEDIASVRPLVDIQNFLSKVLSGEVFLSSFFMEKDLSSEGKASLKNFLSIAAKWQDTAKKNFIKGSLQNKVTPGFEFKDPIQDFMNEDGSIDENVVTAVIASSYSWIADALQGPALLKEEAILGIFDLTEDDAAVTPEGMTRLSRVTATEDTVVNSLGAVVVKSLGLKEKTGAPDDYLTKLEAAFGVHALRLLEAKGMIHKRSMSGGLLNELVSGLNVASNGKYPNGDLRYPDFTFVEIVRNKDLSVGGDALGILDASKGSQSAVDRLFQSDPAPKEASWEPITFRQKFAKGTKQGIPDDLHATVDEYGKHPHRIIPEMWNALKVLGNEVFLTAAGWVEYDENKIQEDNRDSVLSQNNNLENQLNNTLALVSQAISSSPKGIGQPFYMLPEIWRNFRVGIATRDLNMQTSKLQRFMFARPNWTVTLDLTNEKQVEHFKVALAAAFGIKTDQQPNRETIEKFTTKLKDPKNRIVELANKLHEANRTPEIDTLSVEDKKAIGQLAAKAEGMQTLQALVALGNYLAAKANKEPEVTVSMLVGVDGKTNGMILTHIALGAAPNAEGLFKVLNRGGIFQLGDYFKNFNHWYKQASSLDLYEDLARVILSKIPTNMRGLDSFYAITGELIKGSEVMSAGRKIVKTPLTAFGFGSSIKAAVRAMERAFIKSVTDRSEAVVNGEDPNMNHTQLIQHINVLIKLGGGKFGIDPHATPKDLMDMSLSRSQREALGSAFKLFMAEPVNISMNGYFKVFKARRDAVNRNIQASFAIYNTVYQALRKARIESLMDSGEIAFSSSTGFKQDSKGNKVAVPVVRTPRHGMTKEQEAELRAEVQQIMPWANSAYSAGTDNLQNGLYMAKTERKLNQSKDQQVKVQLGEAFVPPEGGKPVSHVYAKAMERGEVDPGLAGLPYMIHSADSAAILHALKNTQIFNVFDEAANGPDKVTQTAQAINKSVWETLLRYSPAKESYEMLERAITNVVALAESGKVDTTTLSSLQGVLLGMLKEVERDSHALANLPRYVLQKAKKEHIKADLIRLRMMANGGAVDQYTWEGGEFIVTDELRKEAEDLYAKESAQSEVHPATLDAADTLNDLFNGVDPGRVFGWEDQDVDMELVAEMLQVLPVNGPLAIEMVAKELGEPVTLAPVVEQVKAGIPMVDAITSMEDPIEQAAVVQAVARTADKFSPKRFSVWGEVGPAKVESDPALVSLFGSAESLTAQQVWKELAPKLTGFNKALLGMLSAVMDPALRLQMVSPYTPESDVLDKSLDNARGWYVRKNGAQAVYLLSPAFVHSGLTAETLLHEMLHTVLAGIIRSETKAKNPNSEAYQLIQELDRLRLKAVEFMDKNGLADKFKAAVSNVDELVSWGMTNREFQTEVMEKISLTPKNTKTALIQGMKGFIKTLKDLLFAGTGKSHQAITVNGMSVLISNVSGLFAHAKGKPLTTEDINLSHASTPPSYSTTDMYAALSDGSVTDSFDTHLRTVLSGIVEKLHGPFGSFKEKLMQDQTITAQDRFLQAQATGVAPFASKIIASAFKAGNQTAFVMEQVEATIRAALSDNDGHSHAVYHELGKLFVEAKNKLTVEKFHPGAWATATADEKLLAEEKRNFVFNQAGTDAQGRSDYLARFAALGLGNEEFNGLLQFATAQAPIITKDHTLAGMLKRTFDRVLEVFHGRLTHTTAGQQADAKLTALVTQLVDIEGRRKEVLDRAATVDLQDRADDLLKDWVGKARISIGQAGRSKAVKASKSAAVRVGGALVSMIAEDRVALFMEGVKKMRDSEFKGKLGVVAEVINDIKGPGPKNNKMLLQTKHNEKNRLRMITQYSQNVLDSFMDKGENLDDKSKHALSAVLVRTGAHVLLDQDRYSLAQIESFMSDPKALAAAVKDLEDQLRSFPKPVWETYLGQSRALGYQLATGKATVAFLLRNAGNIAKMLGTRYADRMSADQVSQATPVIDALVTLYAFQYSKPGQLGAVSAVMRDEAGRTDKGNGVLMTLLTQKALEKESLNRLFSADPSQMLKGYVPETYNPYTDIKVVNQEEGKVLMDAGYSQGAEVAADPADAFSDAKNVYVLRDGGLLPWLSGAMSFQGKRAKGSSILGTHAPRQLDQITAAKQTAIQKLATNGSTFDPTMVRTTHAVPLLNAKGDVVNYQYLMHNSTKDITLERDNRFERLIGTLAGSITGKVDSEEHNAEIVKALKEQYDLDYTANPDAYVKVSPDSPDSEMREIYSMLPKATQQAIRDTWGKDGMMVNNEVLNLMFGYRKLSLSTAFDKDAAERTAMEQMFVWWVENTLDTYGKLRIKADPTSRAKYQNYGKRGAVSIRRGERIWQGLVQEVKDILVVKRGLTLLGNFSSNISLLRLHGVPILDMARLHQEGYQGAVDYQNDSNRLLQLEQQVGSGYVMGDVSDVQQEIEQLKDSLSRNPVRKLIESGLMPSIVEDVAATEDIYSWKSELVRKTEKFTDKLNPAVVGVAKLAYMTHDTAIYKTLSQLTQLSDFVARYTLYQHLTTRKINPMSPEAAIEEASESFINYDIPMARALQYTDDMGITMFTKYFLRIQRVLARRFKEAPGRVMTTLLLHNYLDVLPGVMDSSALAHAGNNPLNTGAVQIFTSLDELATVKAGMSLFK